MGTHCFVHGHLSCHVGYFPDLQKCDVSEHDVQRALLSGDPQDQLVIAYNLVIDNKRIADESKSAGVLFDRNIDLLMILTNIYETNLGIYICFDPADEWSLCFGLRKKVGPIYYFYTYQPT